MKKLTSFILGLLIILPLSASTHYIKNDGTGIYDYSGDTVSTISIDFSQWAATDLPSTLSDDMELVEVEKDGQFYGFVKWKLVWYNSGTVNQRVLFNNSNGDFPQGEKNDKTSTPPAIYFPTTVRGIKSIDIKYLAGSSSPESYGWLQYRYTDKTGSVAPASIKLPVSEATNPQTYTIEVNSQGPTTVYFLYKVNVWPRILSIDFTLVEDPATSISETEADTRVIKRIENGQLVIIKNGVRYNILGSNF